MKTKILRMPVNVLRFPDAIERVLNWTHTPQSRYICVSNVHMCMEAFDSAEFAAIINHADLTVPDGLPLVWAQKLLGHPGAQQVRGTDLTLALCQAAAERGIPVGFFGATPELLQQLKKAFLVRFPQLAIVYAVAPPFRAITEEEDRQFVRDINASGARLLFVGLGCPKQEKWMAEHRGALTCTMLGVGAAFDFIAGNKKPAPLWMQRCGLEWLFRLLSEPKRLWKRYLKHNPRFVWFIGWQVLKNRYEW